MGLNVVIMIITIFLCRSAHAGYINGFGKKMLEGVLAIFQVVVEGAATECMLSLTTAWVRILAWACEKVASDLGLGGGFRCVLRFPPLLTTG